MTTLQVTAKSEMSPEEILRQGRWDAWVAKGAAQDVQFQKKTTIVLISLVAFALIGAAVVLLGP